LEGGNDKTDERDESSVAEAGALAPPPADARRATGGGGRGAPPPPPPPPPSWADRGARVATVPAAADARGEAPPSDESV